MGEVPIEQLESRFGRNIPQERCHSAEGHAIEVFRSIDDDTILDKIDSHSSTLEDLCERGRGEEISKSGLLWRCPSCGRSTTPGKARRGGGFEDKACPHCSLTLTSATVNDHYLVAEPPAQPYGNGAPFIDGDDINGRYVKVVPTKFIDLGCNDFPYKGVALYAPPKLLIRQAGVGLSATLDDTASLCPQSVYVHRLKANALAQGYSHEFLLAALLSRTMAYVVFKKFAEVDAARAFAKVTLARLRSLPIPSLDFNNPRHRELHDSIKRGARDLLERRETIGGRTDLEIEQGLRELWGLSPQDGATINQQLATLPPSRALLELSPLPIRSEATEVAPQDPS